MHQQESLEGQFATANPALSGCHFPAVTVISHMAVMAQVTGSKIVVPTTKWPLAKMTTGNTLHKTSKLDMFR